MIYFANPSTPSVREAMGSNPLLGAIITPAQGNKLPPAGWWCADNGLGPGRGGGVGRGQLPTDEAWFEWLTARVSDGNRDRCLFAVAPDVVGDHSATLVRSRPWLAKIRALGVPAAFVAQNGIELDTWDPWDEIDALFIGGDDAFKLGEHPRELTAVANGLGKWVHMGGVNSEKRWRYAAAIGCDSADGTYLAFGPDINLPNVLAWARNADQPALFGDLR